MTFSNYEIHSDFIWCFMLDKKLVFVKTTHTCMLCHFLSSVYMYMCNTCAWMYNTCTFSSNLRSSAMSTLVLFYSSQTSAKIRRWRLTGNLWRCRRENPSKSASLRAAVSHRASISSTRRVSTASATCWEWSSKLACIICGYIRTCTYGLIRVWTADFGVTSPKQHVATRVLEC